MSAYRNDVDALATRHAALAEELAHKTREVASAAQILDEARAKARLPVLDNIRVATPCPADWNKMEGDERSRHCGECKKSVFNISGLTRDEAQSLMIEKNGELCVRYFQRKDGTILLKDCSIGIAQKRKTKVIAAGAMLLLGGAALFAFKRPSPEKLPTEKVPPTMMTLEPIPSPPPVHIDPDMMAVAGGISAPPEAMMGAPLPPPKEVHKLKAPHHKRKP